MHGTMNIKCNYFRSVPRFSDLCRKKLIIYQFSAI